MKRSVLLFQPAPLGGPWLILLSLLCLVLACSPQARGGGGDDDSAGDDDDSADDDDGGPPLGDAFDILLVVDNSNSMARIQEEVQDAFPDLLEALSDSGVDWQLGVTTTDLQSSGAGNQGNLRSDEPIGDAACEPDLVTSDDEPEAAETLFRSLVDVGVSGSTDEKGVYAAALALCKGKDAAWWDGLDELPAGDPVRVVCSLVPGAERTCNAGAFRAEVPTVVVTVSDEGDDTHRSELLPPASDLQDCLDENYDAPFFGECECRIGWWHDFFVGIGQDVVFVTVGPTYLFGSQEVVQCDGSTTSYPGPCNPFGASVCAMDFYQRIACLTGGRFFPMEETDVENEPSTCDVADFQGVADGIRDLLLGTGR